MALKCDVCDKRTVHGNTHIHRHSRWRFRAPKTKRTWIPNIRNVTIVGTNGKAGVSMCMGCYKRYQQVGVPFLLAKKVKGIRNLAVAL